MLRVAAAGVPAVGILIPCLQTNQTPIGSPRIDVSLCQCRLERDWRLHGIGKANTAIALPHGNEVACCSRKVQVISAYGRRRKNLRTRRGMSSDDFRLPRLAPGRLPHAIDELSLRIQDLSLPHRRPPPLIAPSPNNPPSPDPPLSP